MKTVFTAIVLTVLATSAFARHVDRHYAPDGYASWPTVPTACTTDEGQGRVSPCDGGGDAGAGN